MAKFYLKDYPKPTAQPEVAAMDWECAPCGVSRDSDPLTRANFDALTDELDGEDPYGKDWEILRFGHFAAGWIESIFVRPGSSCAAVCDEARDRMAAYPCLDEDLWVEYDAAVNVPTKGK